MSILSSSLYVGIGTTTPNANLEIYGTTPQLRITDTGADYSNITQAANGGILSMQGADGTTKINLRAYSTGTQESYFLDQKIGIGTVSPLEALHVVGDIYTTDDIFLGDIMYHTADTDTYLNFDTDRVLIGAGGQVLADFYEGTQDYAKLGDGGDVDINLNDMMFVEGSSGNVGIGTTTTNGDTLRVDSGAYNLTVTAAN